MPRKSGEAQKMPFWSIQSDNLRNAQNKVLTRRNVQLPQIMHGQAQNDPQTYRGGNVYQYQYILGRIEAFKASQGDSKGLILPQKFNMWTMFVIHLFPPPTQINQSNGHSNLVTILVLLEHACNHWLKNENVLLGPYSEALCMLT